MEKRRTRRRSPRRCCTACCSPRLGRRFIGIERDPVYAVIARRRIAEVSPAASEALALESRRKAPRIPFGNLIERGLIRPGEVLFDQTRRHQARVRADGSLISAEHRGSIHSVGALVQGAPACNGWAFWYVQRNGQPLPIDSLRQLVRTELEPPGRRAERAINRALTRCLANRLQIDLA